MVIVLAWATVELSVAVIWPLTSVVGADWFSTFPEPLTVHATVFPDERLPLPSLAVTVIVEVDTPWATSRELGLATPVEAKALPHSEVKGTVDGALSCVE